MTNEAQTIVKWATSQYNGHGAHIDALNYAINSDKVSDDVIIELKETKTKWVEEHNNGFFKAV